MPGSAMLKATNITMAMTSNRSVWLSNGKWLRSDLRTVLSAMSLVLCWALLGRQDGNALSCPARLDGGQTGADQDDDADAKYERCPTENERPERDVFALLPSVALRDSRRSFRGSPKSRSF